MRQTIPFTSWGKGELSPYVRGRVDTLHYYSSAKSLQNMIVRPYGNPVRRPGTKYVGAVKDSTEDVRLIEFVFNTATSYIIEMGNLYLRFYKDNELVTLDLDAIAAWQTATAYSMHDLVKIVDGASVKYYLCTVEHTSAATISGGTYDAWETDTDYTNTGSWWQVETADQVSHNGKNYTCKDTHTSEAKYEPGVGSRWTQAWRVLGSYEENDNWQEFISAEDQTGLWTVEIPTSYTEAQIWDVDYAQKNDVIKFTHQAHDITELRRYSDTIWTFIPAGIIDGPPWGAKNSSWKKRVAPSVSVVSTTGNLVANHDCFTADSAGRFMSVGGFHTDGGSGGQGYVRIISYTNSTTVAIEVMAPISTGTDATSNWAWNAFYEDNYPANVTYHEGRLVLASTPKCPQQVYFSRSFIYNSFNTGDTAAFGFSLELNTEQANKISWLSSGQSLSMGTFGGEFISSSPRDGSLSGLTINSKRQSSWGSTFIKPSSMGSRGYFVQRGLRKLREMFYVFANNNYDASDMTEYSEHITLSGIKEISYQRNQDSLLWSVLINGSMAVLTRAPADDVMAWTPWSTTNGSVKSIRFTPNPDGLTDRGTMIVERTIGGETVKYIESFDNHVLENDTLQEDLYYVDCGVEYTQASAADTDFTGLSHLEGQTVAIFVDGIYQGTDTVEDGEVTNTSGAWLKACVGLPYTSTVQINPINTQTPSPAKGKIRRIHSVALDVYKSLGMEYSSDGTNWFPVSVPEGTATDELFTGIIPNLTFEGILDYTGYIYLRQTKPYPMNLLGIYASVLIAEDK